MRLANDLSIPSAALRRMGAGAVPFTPAWQQFSGTAWLGRTSDLTGMPANATGFTVAMTISPSATDLSNNRAWFNPTSGTTLFRISTKSNGAIEALADNSSGTLIWSLTTAASAVAVGGRYLVLFSLQSGAGRLTVINLATGAVVGSASSTSTGTLAGASASWVIGALTLAATYAITGQMERAQLWLTYNDASNATVQGYFHDAGALKDPAVAAAALGSPIVSIVGNALQTGANAGSGGDFVKDGAGTIAPA